MIDPIALVVGILADALDVPVSTEVPRERPDRLVTVDLAGDHSTPYVLQPRYQILCWGRSDQEAHAMARACLDALWAAADEHPYLSSCQLESMARDEWTSTGQGRYLLVVDLTINTDE